MEAVFQWIKNITYYLLFVSLLSYLMPSGKYEQYVKLFFGAVFILLVIRPLTDGLHIDASLVQDYERIRFTQEQKEFQQKLWGMEEERMAQMMKEYEEAVSQDIRAMADEEGFNCISARARIEEREEEESFGQVVEIVMVLGQGEGAAEIAGDNRGSVEGTREQQDGKTVSIDPVQVVIGQEDRSAQGMAGKEAGEGERGDEGEGRVKRGSEREEAEGDSGGGAERGSEGEGAGGSGGGGERGSATEGEEVWEAVEEFQRKVARYYGLEEEAVQITWKDD